MKNKGFATGIFIILSAVFFSIMGCTTLKDSRFEQRQEKEVRLMWYDPFGTISFKTKDGNLAELELSFGYDIRDRTFLSEFGSRLKDVRFSIISECSKKEASELTASNSIDLENEILKTTNKICGKNCKVLKINIVRLEFL